LIANNPATQETETMTALLTAKDLIARMTPIAMAEMLASFEIIGNLDEAERRTAKLIQDALVANVGDDVAKEMITKATCFG
jgi:hypothetical protein